MKNTLSYLVTSIVDSADKVKIEESEEQGIVHYFVKVAKEDMGKVIGKQGKVIKSIRNVMKIPAMKTKKKIDISLVEEE